MQLSTKTRYSTRAMIDLALRDGDGMVSAREISERLQISQKYLEQLLVALRSAGLLKSARGAHGGYALARPADQITLREIYEAFEEGRGFVECTADPQSCDIADGCAAQRFWAQFYARSMEILESTTIAELARRTRIGMGDAEKRNSL